ncbi:MAG: hypothetical protein ACXIUQ_13855 [Cecembia sp.]
MKLKLFIIAFIATMLSFFQTIKAQEVPKRNAIFVEVYGTGLFHSVNYDMRFDQISNGLGTRIGIGYTAIDGVRVFTLPIAFNYLIGKKRNFLELGVGGTGIFLNQGNIGSPASGLDISSSTAIVHGMLGYRRVSASGFLLRAGITPLFNGSEFIPFVPQASLGFAF